ncbi:MAG: hypothetical protein WC797_03960 [Candidatus Paceibacterota bacterium]|jgi:hypothetical protein
MENKKPQTALLAWITKEHIHGKKDKDWIWAVAIIGIATAIGSVLLSNWLFGLFAILAAGALILRGQREPAVLDIAVTNQGINISSEFFPFDAIESFWIREEKNGAKILVLRTYAKIMHLARISMENTDPESVREVLIKFIPETYHQKNLVDVTSDWLGF